VYLNTLFLIRWRIKKSARIIFLYEKVYTLERLLRIFFLRLRVFYATTRTCF